jgi:hypothetical protein
MKADIVMNQAERESSNSMDNMVPVSAQHTASNNNGRNASRRNQSIETQDDKYLF